MLNGMDDSGLSKIFEQTLKSVGIPGFLVVPGFVLMAPDGWLDCIGLLKARNDHKMWFGVALLLGIAMLIKAVGSYVWKLAQEVTTRVKQRRELDRFIQLMDTLDDQETLLLVKAHVDYFGDAAYP